MQSNPSTIYRAGASSFSYHPGVSKALLRVMPSRKASGQFVMGLLEKYRQLLPIVFSGTVELEPYYVL